MKKVILANITIIVVFIFFLELVSNFFKLSNLKGIEPGLIIANGDIHQMSANSSGIHFGQKIYIDQYGFRVPSKDFFYKKNNKSIFIIGDSTAFGNGIPEQKTFVGKLREFFTNLNFYNSSVPGYNIKHFQANIDKVDNFDNVKKVFYFITLNDIYGGQSILDLTQNKNLNHENISIKKNSLINKLNAFLSSKSYFYMFFKGIISDPSKRYFKNIKKNYEKTDLSNMKDYISNLNEKLNRENIDLKVFILPYEFQTRNCSNENLVPQNKINLILKDLKVYYQDLTNNFCKHSNPKSLFYKFDPMHLSNKGHSLVFNLIKNEI